MQDPLPPTGGRRGGAGTRSGRSPWGREGGWRYPPSVRPPSPCLCAPRCPRACPPSPRTREDPGPRWLPRLRRRLSAAGTVWVRLLYRNRVCSNIILRLQRRPRKGTYHAPPSANLHARMLPRVILHGALHCRRGSFRTMTRVRAGRSPSTGDRRVVHSGTTPGFKNFFFFLTARQQPPAVRSGIRTPRRYPAVVLVGLGRRFFIVASITHMALLRPV